MNTLTKANIAIVLLALTIGACEVAIWEALRNADAVFPFSILWRVWLTLLGVSLLALVKGRRRLGVALLVAALALPVYLAGGRL